MMDLDRYLEQLAEACSVVSATRDPFPRIGIVAGTGLGGLADRVTSPTLTPYSAIPHFPVSTVQSHAGSLLCGSLSGTPVAVLQGRFHLYEGYSPWEVVFPIRVLAQCGIELLIVTNAAGGLDLSFSTGDIMVIRDHINMMGANALAGPHHAGWGDRFPDMSCVYDQSLRTAAHKCAAARGVQLREGVYVGVRGPSLETPSETRLFREAGGDAIGMSTVQEVLAAHQSGIRVLGFSVITNVNDPVDMAPASVESIIEAAEGASERLSSLIGDIVARPPA
jgi:purine-nucleoside phosphorylase